MDVDKNLTSTGFQSGNRVFHDARSEGVFARIWLDERPPLTGVDERSLVHVCTKHTDETLYPVGDDTPDDAVLESLDFGGRPKQFRKSELAKDW